MTEPAPNQAEFSRVVASSLWRSGGTFVFNVAKALLQKHGLRQEVIRSSLMDDYLRQPSAHAVEEWWRRFDRPSDRFLFAYRDIRDIVASDIQRGTRHYEDPRFLISFVRTSILKDRFLAAKAKQGWSVGELRFETEINGAEPIAISKVADYLGLDHHYDNEVFEEFSFERISAWYRQEREALGDLTSRDPVYHLHDRHLGDRRVGKYRDVLPESMLALMYGETDLANWIAERGYKR